MGVAHVRQIPAQDWQVRGAESGRGVPPHRLLKLPQVGRGQGALHPLQVFVEKVLERLQERLPVLLPRRALQVSRPAPAVRQQRQHQVAETLLRLRHHRQLLGGGLGVAGRRRGVSLGEEGIDGVEDLPVGLGLLQHLHHHGSLEAQAQSDAVSEADGGGGRPPHGLQQPQHPRELHQAPPAHHVPRPRQRQPQGHARADVTSAHVA